LLERFRYVHSVRKVVGVGSVGTRVWIVLLLGRDEGDPLFLQIKEAEASVLEPFPGKSTFSNHGQRVVEGQQLTQAAFAEAYADQNDRDYKALQAAVASGRIKAETGL
jgi:uncharacterized protein (DUF2252 family)